MANERLIIMNMAPVQKNGCSWRAGGDLVCGSSGRAAWTRFEGEAKNDAFVRGQMVESFEQEAAAAKQGPDGALILAQQKAMGAPRPPLAGASAWK